MSDELKVGDFVTISEDVKNGMITTTRNIATGHVVAIDVRGIPIVKGICGGLFEVNTEFYRVYVKESPKDEFINAVCEIDGVSLSGAEKIFELIESNSLHWTKTNGLTKEGFWVWEPEGD